MSDARSVALEVLRRLRRDEVYVNLALSAELDRKGLGASDRGLATELVYGVLRHRARLDHALSQHVERPLSRTKAEVLDALRLAAYQLLALDRVPAHAAVSEAVEHVRRARGSRVAGFVNAVLRRLAEAASQDRAAAWGPLPEGGVQRIALEHSLPLDLVERLATRLPDEEQLAQLARAFTRTPSLGVRINPKRIEREALAQRLRDEGAREVSACSLSPWGLRVSGLSDAFRKPSYLEGLWTAQDEAAQLAVAALEPSATGVRRVLDACAGVGGKTTLLAALVPSGARLLAADSSARKLSLLADHCRRLGVEATRRELDLGNHDALEGEGPFDRILLDAPCSALGLIGRHPELKWRWSAERVDDLVALQRALLTTVASRLAPGGLLVYSVCTVTDEEGPQQLSWARDNLGLVPAPPPSDLPGAEHYDGASLALWPHRQGTDGFFIARMRRAS